MFVRPRVLCAVFTVLLCVFSACFFPAAAYGSAGITAGSSGFDRFTKQNVYWDNTFKDVKESDWFSSSVKACYELGLLSGREGGVFAPADEVSLAEAVSIAARLHNIYGGGSGSIEQTGSTWYDGALDYASANGILERNAFDDYTRPATRGELAHIFSCAIPQTGIEKINEISSIPDVPAGHPYVDSILALYNAGVLTGNDTYGSFSPDALIKRSETAVIVTRLANPDLRQELELTPPPSELLHEFMDLNQLYSYVL